MAIAEPKVRNAPGGASMRDSFHAGRPTSGLQRVGSALLRLPLFYKLVIANGAITLGAVIACAALLGSATDGAAQLAVEVVVPVVAAATIVGLVVNALVVRLALTPIRSLELTAEQVRAGDESARAGESAVSDTSTEQLAQTFNAMLDSLALYRGRLREIAIRALDAAENERLRLSRELNDNIAQSLTALLLQLKVARAGNENAHPQIQAIAQQLSSIIEELRALATQLRPAALDMLGLHAALAAHARGIREATGMAVEVQIDGVDELLSEEAELALYRIVQEALLNVARHAATKAARLEVKPENGHVRAIISDRGRGFSVSPTLASGALGLIGMVERAAYVGGQVDIHSEPGQGTTIRIDIPIKDGIAHV